MKRLFILFMVVFVLFAVNSYALEDGLYQGSFFMYVDNPVQCMSAISGYARIENLEDHNILYQGISMWNGNEHVLYEAVCVVNENAIKCPDFTQIIDFTKYGFDAIVTNETSHGEIVQKGDISFKTNNSVKRNYCAGSDCNLVEQWMGVNFPCMMGPWISEFKRVGD